MSATTTIKRLGLEKAFQYLYKDPEKNLPKLIDWADKFSKGEFPSQRAAVRAAIEDPDFVAAMAALGQKIDYLDGKGYGEYLAQAAKDVPAAMATVGLIEEPAAA